MITLVTEPDDLFLQKSELGNSFIGIKILSELLSYGTNYGFISFYKQSIGGVFAAALCKTGSNILMYSNAMADINEIRDFCFAVGFDNIQTCDDRLFQNSLIFQNSLNPKPQKFTVLKKKISAPFNNYKSDSDFYFNGNYKRVYEILTHSPSPDICMPDLMGFYADISHKVRRKTACTAVLYNSAAAIISHIYGHSGVLSGIAVLPKRQKSGYGSEVLNGAVSSSGIKTVYTAASKNNLPFYIKNGFTELYSVYSYTKQSDYANA